MAVGKISAIVKEGDEHVKTMTSSLAAKGKSRFPGTGIYFFPKKTISGKYLTGLDEEAPDIMSIIDDKERKARQKAIKEKRERLEDATGLDLSPTSKFWNYALYTSSDSNHVQPYRLSEGDNLFDFKDPMSEISFNWLKQCDDIAPSYESYVRGDKGPEVRFYVHDDEIESERIYSRKKKINKAIEINDSLSPDKRKKIAALMGIKISGDVKETTVYNLIDDKFKETEYSTGKFRGMSPLNLFLSLTSMENKELNIKFLVDEALNYNVYRTKPGGAIYEGEYKVSLNKDEMIKFLMDDAHQEELIALEKKVKHRKLLEV